MTPDEKAKVLLSGRYCGNCFFYKEENTDNGLILMCKGNRGSNKKSRQEIRYEYCDNWVENSARIIFKKI